MTEAVQKEFLKLIEESCTFVPDWEDNRLQPDMLRMFATHSARRDAEGRLMAANFRRFEGQLVEATSIDREASIEGNWLPASSTTSKVLTHKLKQPQTLYFYPRAVYEITYNKKDHFAQSQLAVLAEVPTQAQVRTFQPVKILVAPPGTKAIARDLQTNDDFLRAGFKLDEVGQAPSYVQYIGLGFQAKREQYGLRPRIASTIHAGMGQDLPAVISKVDGDTKFRLFQREQVVVLLSRTHFAKDIYFVGDPVKTARVLWEALQIRSVFDDYLDYVMKQLTEQSTVEEHRETERGSGEAYHNTIDLATFHPYRPIDNGLPQVGKGGKFVYILASLHPNYLGQATYIGQTTDLIRRYKQHNSGSATKQTADPSMRPWTMLGYVSGFQDCSVSALTTFEALWQGKRKRANENRSVPLTAEQVVELGEQIVRDKLYTSCIELQDKRLLFHRCGKILTQPIDPMRTNPTVH
jgi:predicted GIY-YIG superfamily endonuclease